MVIRYPFISHLVFFKITDFGVKQSPVERKRSGYAKVTGINN